MTERRYNITELTPYIDWVYFLHAWEMPPKADEAKALMDDGRQMLREMDGEMNIVARVGLFDACSQGDDIMLTTGEGTEVRIPCLRQQHPADGKPNLCLADFVRPEQQEHKDTVGVFATTVGLPPATDQYRSLLCQTLCDRLAEAAACRLHEEVRKVIWGYAANEQLSISEMLREKNVGIRPAVGYPSLPDQSINFLLARLIGMDEMGITITENGAMKPHATVSGLMIAHPKAHYFTVGRIDRHQLEDYASRRGLPAERMMQFLQGNYTE